MSDIGVYGKLPKRQIIDVFEYQLIGLYTNNVVTEENIAYQDTESLFIRPSFISPVVYELTVTVAV